MASAKPGPKRPGPGRPSSGQGPAVTRDAIVSAAARSFADRGYTRTTFASLADELGVSVAAIQHRFRSKQQLFEAVVDEQVLPPRPAAPASTTTPIASGRDPADPPIVQAMRARVQRALDAPGLTPKILHDATDGSDGRLAYLAAATRPGREASRAALSAAVDAGAIRAVDVDATLALITLGVSAIMSAPGALDALLDLDLGEPATAERMSDGIIDILWNGLRPRPDDAPGSR